MYNQENDFFDFFTSPCLSSTLTSTNSGFRGIAVPPGRGNYIMTQLQPSSLLLECAQTPDAAPDVETLLLCMAHRLEALEIASSKHVAGTTQWLLIFAGALVFMMQTGFAVSTGGGLMCFPHPKANPSIT
jgi:hypothetical protein